MILFSGERYAILMIRLQNADTDKWIRYSRAHSVGAADKA
jgi:hypothetical protein